MANSLCTGDRFSGNEFVQNLKSKYLICFHGKLSTLGSFHWKQLAMATTAYIVIYRNEKHHRTLSTEATAYT